MAERDARRRVPRPRATWCGARRSASDQLASLVRAGALRRVRPQPPPAAVGAAAAPRPGRAGRGAASWRSRWTPPPPRRCRGMTDWERMVSDHEAMSLTTGPHPMALLRPSLDAAHPHLADLLHRRAAAGRSRSPASSSPASGRATAKGIVFLLVEDEHGMTNVICPPPSTSATGSRSGPSRSCRCGAGSSGATAPST